MSNYSKQSNTITIVVVLLSCVFVCSEANSIKDQKVSASIENLLSRVRRQSAGDIGGTCTTTAECMAGNGGANSECVIPPMDEVLKCSCLPGFGINLVCVASCTADSQCATGICTDGQCAPPCGPVQCNAGTCPSPLFCNANNICVPDCFAILPVTQTPPAGTTTTAGPGDTTTAGPGSGTTTAPTSNIAPILQCTQNGVACPNVGNAVCMNNVCVCIAGTSLVNGNCNPIGGPNGPCDSNNQCPGGVNLMCDTTTNTCVCVPGSTLLDGSCIPSGLPGGRCDGGRCPGDLNAVCSIEHGLDVCLCKSGTTKVEGTCLEDGTVGGKCDGDGFMCTKDQYAECQGGEPFGICVCVPGARKIESMCVLDGVVGGKCNVHFDDICSRDPNAECIDGYCVCKPWYKKVEGACVAIGKPGAGCTETRLCPYDMMSACATNSTCACMGNSVKMGEGCVAAGYDGGKCSYGKCFNKHSMCDYSRNRCVCRPGSTAVAGQCITLEFLHWIHIKIMKPFNGQAGSDSPVLIHRYV